MGEYSFEVDSIYLKLKESIFSVYFMRLLLKIDTIITGRFEIYNCGVKYLQKCIYACMQKALANASFEWCQSSLDVRKFYSPVEYINIKFTSKLFFK